MKNLVMVLVVGVFLLALISYAAPASAGMAFEDPQLCLNGKLFRVDPTTAPLDVWLNVGENVNEDFNIANCGGNPDLPTLDPKHVTYDGRQNTAGFAVQTARQTRVDLYFDGRGMTRNSGNDGWVMGRLSVGGSGND